MDEVESESVSASNPNSLFSCLQVNFQLMSSSSDNDELPLGSPTCINVTSFRRKLGRPSVNS